jgi:tetratricopeptide (TPR) repeat protein
MRSLEKDPNARFQSAAEFLQALLDYEQSGGLAREEVSRAASKTPQVTHSMTEVISYDTRPAPITATSPPRAVQPSIATQVMEPAQAERSVAAATAAQPRRYGLLVAAALVTLIAAAAVAFMFLKQSGATTASTLTSVAQPTGQPIAQEDARLKQAREAEAQERYLDAAKLYGAYLQENAQAADAAALTTRMAELERLHGLLYLAELEMSKQDYTEARHDYAEALKLRPDSKRAQDGLAKAESHLAGAR